MFVLTVQSLISHGFCMIIQIMIFALWFSVKIFTAVFFSQFVLWIKIYLKFKWYQTSVGWQEFWKDQKKNLSVMDFDKHCNSSKPISHGFWVIIQIVIFALWFPVKIFIASFFSQHVLWIEIY